MSNEQQSKSKFVVKSKIISHNQIQLSVLNTKCKPTYTEGYSVSGI